jgi:3-deoxy-manno-octulosonate cytidylyltransferase (CMP-KDO synthetase)
MPKSPLEEAESLEQLRVLENGYRIRVLATDYNGFGIDTEADLLRAEERLRMKS